MGATQHVNITVILPVYKDVKITRECIQRCLPDIVTQSGRLILINDASPECGMQDMLEEWSAKYPDVIKIIVNQENQGFVVSVNKGLSEACGHDVVLLNSDVFTPRGWLGSLRREAANIDKIGTLTPLSNNSTITSLPINNENGSCLLNYDVDLINNSFEGSLPLVKAPTGIGFCMYIAAKCLSVVGYLDEEAFSKGYGEESDFCQRAIKAGFVNALTPNLYCHHIGRVSFCDSTTARLEDASKKIAELHPHYHLDVASWIMADPFSSARVARSLQIYKGLGIPFILHINHSIGGGPMKYVTSLIAETKSEAVHIVFFGRRTKHDPLRFTIFYPGSDGSHEILFNNDAAAPVLLKSLGIDCIHIHHLAGTPKSVVNWIRDCDLPHMITYHDYYLINGNPFLAGGRGEYEGINASPFTSLYRHVHCHPFSYHSWTSESHQLIQSSSLNIFPSQSAYGYYSEVFTNMPNSRLVPHQTIRQTNPSLPLTVLSIGALSMEKGADFLEGVAQAADQDKHSYLVFKVIGYSYRLLKGIEQTGPYDDGQLQELISTENPACILFCNRCPETFSYTLSAAIESGYPIVAPMSGIFEERLSPLKKHFLYSPEVKPNQLAKQIRRFVENLSAEDEACVELEPNPFYRTEYLDKVKGFASPTNRVVGQEILKVADSSIMEAYFLAPNANSQG